MPVPWQRMVLLCAAALLAACAPRHGRVAEQPAAGPQMAVFNPQEYEDLDAGRGRVYWIDSRASTVRFYLFRGGVLAARGHNHVMEVTELKGAVFLPTDMLRGDARFDLIFHAVDIQVDPPGLRAALGGAFESPIDAEGMAGTRENMLGEQVLDAQRFPEIGLRSHRIYGEFPRLVIDTVVTLHGFARRFLIPVAASQDGDRLMVEGGFAIRQTDFGIEPFSAMGGALYVQDPISIEFTIIARARQP